MTKKKGSQKIAIADRLAKLNNVNIETEYYINAGVTKNGCARWETEKKTYRTRIENPKDKRVYFFGTLKNFKRNYPELKII